MAEYKCVPAPKILLIGKKDDFQNAVRSFGELINREATDGWKFYSMETITVVKKPGCLAALFGKKEEEVHFNMLIFVKE